MGKTTMVAVTGTGNFGLRHLGVLKTIPGVAGVAVPRRASRVKELVAQGQLAVPSLRLAAAMGARACIVASATGHHVEDALEALDLGMDVLVEKPMASDAPGAERILAKARAKKRKVFVACVLRFSPSLNDFKKRVKAVGRVHVVRVECQAYLPDFPRSRHYKSSYSAKASEGGVLRDLIHEIDYAGWIFGWPQKLAARLQNFGRLGIAAEESADLFWKAAKGEGLSLHVDYLSRPPRRRLRAFGEKGTLSWDGFKGTVTFSQNGSKPKVWKQKQNYWAMLRAQTMAFLAARRGKTDPCFATGEDGVRALAVADAARESARIGRAARVRR